MATLEMRKLTQTLLFLTAAIVAAGSVLAETTAPLVGKWISSDAANGALKGTFVFNTDHSMRMHPEGQPEFQGTWEAKDGDLILSIPEAGGSAKMQYSVAKGVLTLRYENGNTQHFKKSPTKKAKKVLAK